MAILLGMAEESFQNSRIRNQFVLLFLVCLFASWGISRWIVGQSFSLAEQGQLYPEKYFSGPYAISLMGGKNFYFDRQAVAQGALQLHSWHGYQSVGLLHPMPPTDHLQLQAHLGKFAILWIYLGCYPNQECWLLRLSRNPQFGNALVRLGGDEKKLQSIQLDTETPDNKFQIGVEFANSQVNVQINKKTITSLPTERPLEPLIRLRGGFFPASVFKIQTSFRNTQTMNIDFTVPFSWELFGRVFFIFILGGFIFLKMFGVLRLWKPFFAGLLVLGLFFSSLTLFDEFFWKPRYWISGYTPRGMVAPSVWTEIEGLRFDFFVPPVVRAQKWKSLEQMFLINKNTFVDPNNPQVGLASGQIFSIPDLGAQEFSNQFRMDSGPLEGATANTLETCFRIGVLGTSQAWGAGAKGMETWTELLRQQIQSASKGPVCFINYSIPGEHIASLLKMRGQMILDSKPHLLVLDLGFNDSSRSPTEISNQLGNFVDSLQRQNIHPILVGEPVSPESRIYNSTTLTFKQLAAQKDIPFIDADHYFRDAEVMDSGLIWNDLIHLAPYGHKKMADFLSSQLRPIISKIQNGK